MTKALDVCLTELCAARQEWLRKRIRALQLIESRSVTALVVARNHGKALARVARMDWFINAVAERVPAI